jgi:hypothetical protein
MKRFKNAWTAQVFKPKLIEDNLRIGYRKREN